MKPKPTLRPFLLGCSSLLAFTSLHAAPVISESFDYATGNVSGQNGGTGFTAAWSSTKGVPQVDTPDKLWGGLNSAGNHARGGAWSGLIRPIGSTLADANLLDDGATLWFSVVFDLQNQNFTNADLNIALCSSSTTKFESSDFGNRFNLNPAAAEGIGIGHTGGNIAGQYWQDDGDLDTRSERVQEFSSLTVTTANPRALIVGKIDWGATGTDPEVMTLYAPGLDLSLGTPILDPGTASWTIPALNQATFNQIAIQFKDTSQIDEIRFGATSADVLPVSTTVPTLAPADIVDDQGGGPIGEDIAVITYTLTFNVPMDLATITDADFDNAGTATATIGSITQPDQTTIQVQVLPTTTGTVQLRIPATSVLSGYNSLNLDTTSAILDDTTITINAGPTIDTGNRYWDGSLTTGPTDGVSQGGNGTWDTATTNWDPGAGFADPVAWNNTNLDTAILGGSNGTVTLGEDITAGGITSTSSYTINDGGNTLTMDVASGTPVINNSTTLTINAPIAGSDGLQKTGGGSLAFSTSVTTHSYSGGFTLDQGELNVQSQGTNDSFLGTGTFTINGANSPVIRLNGTWTVDNPCVFTAGILRTTRPGGSVPLLNITGNVELQGNISFQRSGTVDHSVALNGDVSENGGSFGIELTNGVRTDTATLTLGGNNSYTGGTTLVIGLLNLNSPGALGNGPLTIGDNQWLGNTSGGPVTIGNSNAVSFQGFTFKGPDDLNLGDGNATLTNNKTVTVETGTLTFGGPVGQSGGTRSLTKAGAGTLALAGTNTYDGATTVNAGTLALVGGSQSSAITVASGASLGFTLGSPITSTSSVDLTNGTVKIDGTPTLSSYTLMTADGGFTGTPTLDAAIPGYVLEVDGTALELNSTGAGTPYENWAGPGVLFGDDANGDGVSNGLAFLLGAADPDVSALDKLPVVTETGGGLVMTFSMLDSASRGTAALSVEHSSDLGISDAWTTVAVPDATPAPQVPPIDFQVSGGPGTLSVTATIASSEAAAGKLFGRLKATE